MARATYLSRRNLGLARQYVRSLVPGLRASALFDDVETYCMFVGYPRSGHSLIGALLDAHPRAIVSHELGVLAYVRNGFRRDQIYSLILERSRRDAALGRTSNEYRYDVPGQAQGTFERLQVIGDKNGAHSSRHIRHDPDVLGRLRDTVGVPLRIIHVSRNPFDNIATMSARDTNRRSLAANVDAYFRLCEAVELTRSMTAPDELIDVRHEDHVLDPKRVLTQLCSFLGLTASDDYLRACAEIVFESPKRSRQVVDWTPELVGQVQRRIGDHPFLAGYAFDD